MIINEMKLSEYGTFLGTRELGKKVKEAMEKDLLLGDPLIVNFSDVHGITNSFADECFGKFLLEKGKQFFVEKIKFSNLDPTEKSILNFVLYNRTAR